MRHFSHGLWLLFLVHCSETAWKRLLRRLSCIVLCGFVRSSTAMAMVTPVSFHYRSHENDVYPFTWNLSKCPAPLETNHLFTLNYQKESDLIRVSGNCVLVSFFGFEYRSISVCLSFKYGKNLRLWAAANQPIPWVLEVFLSCGRNFRCWPQADTLSTSGEAARKARGSLWRLDRNRKPR